MTGTGVLRLTRADLPATCRSADDLSARGQRRTKLLVRVELLALIGAGVAGLQSLRVGPARLDVLAAVAGVLFLVSLGAAAFRGLSRPEQAWYAGRAAAESVRTLAWRYAVGGDPFPASLGETEAAEALLGRLRGVLGELADLPLAPAGAQERELTDAMRRLRAAPLAERRAVYRRDRVDDQITWYTAKATAHDRAATRWLTLSAAASAVGVVAAGLRVFEVIDLDLLGVAAACASAAIAWNQLGQNRNLVTAYRLTARELAIIRDRIPGTDDAGWAGFVSDAEDAVSREHTMWLARHGHPGLRRR
jgi:hypothetical protein